VVIGAELGRKDHGSIPLNQIQLVVKTKKKIFKAFE
jgi:hypothetical protein